MDHRTFRSFAAFALGALPLAGLTPVSAQSNTQFYSPPKVVHQGTSSSPTVKGTVTLKVFVKRDGSVGPITVKSSTNPADNAAALEIAKSSTYKAGARDAKPEDAYYTFVLRFTSSGAQADTGVSAGLGQATALVRAGKYAEAKTEIQSYLTGHPGDAGAEALLGVADELGNDAAGAAAAFDGAGTIPERYRAVAAKAYGDAAVDALKAKNNDAALALANKGFALQPTNVNLLYVRGTAYANASQYARAIPDFEQAKSLASGKADAATMSAIDASLVTAYLFGGQTDKGLALAADVKRRDPADTRIDPALSAYYNMQAQTAVKAGNVAQAVSQLETAAQKVPAQAAVLYTSAAEVLSNGAKTPDDWKKVKAESDKALAVNPNSARANFVAGIALANAGDSAGATLALQKAKANVGTDTDLSGKIDSALAQLAKK